MSRPPGAADDEHVPIGTRDADFLALTVDGERAVLGLGRGRLTRRSYAVDATCAGTAYRLVPDSFDASRLLRDGRRLGSFTSGLTPDGTCTASADWAAGAAPTPLDAAVGHALAAAFGTGAHPAWMLAVEAVGNLLP
ncbi:hypothetical protein [Streptomyces caatingaensis]|uniref:hypothetical protein n=1 Tax=Streptomyces caatingaensis TaxID=1678637 RepID=UPI000AEB670D|nr:hypothetical protein [Streptomyces caatingaensis]